jgi:hypothetical protein
MENEIKKPDEHKKRGPGRPSKISKQPFIPIEGVVENPLQEFNIFEYVCADPKIFKGLFTYCKSVKSDDILIRCDIDRITFFVSGNGHKSKIIATIAGSTAVRYLCRKTFYMKIKQNNLYQIFSNVDKTFSTATWSCNKYDKDHMFITFKDPELDKNCEYVIKLLDFELDNTFDAYEQMIELENLKKIPVNFILTSNQFKKSITDANSIDEVITIEKSGDSNLKFTTSPGKEVVYSEIYNSDNKIKLQSNIDASSSFRCSFAGKNIKFIASNLVDGYVKVYVSEVQDLILHFSIDKLQIFTFIKINDE